MSASTSQPAAPKTLANLPQWILWKDESGRKKPYSAKGGPGSTIDPVTWATYEEAKNELLLGDYTGLGFVFAEENGLFGVDIDDCVVDGQIAPWAQEIVDAFDTYAEISPSGTGVKLWARGKLPMEDDPRTGRNEPYESGAVEMYYDRRYFAFTGERLEGRDEVKECQGAVDEWFPKLYETKVAEREKGDTNELDVEDILAEEMQRHREMLGDMEESIEGSNGSTAFFLACKAIRRLRLNYDQSMELVNWFNENMCQPSWDSNEVAHKWNEAKRFTDIRDPADLFDKIDDKEDLAANEKPASINATSTHLITHTASDLKCKAVDWFWPGYIPKGMITILDGDPGCGKSSIICDLHARATTGRPMPYAVGFDDGAKVRTTVMLNYEDAIEETTLPRLVASGADLNRVLLVEGALSDTKPLHFPECTEMIAATMADTGAELLTIDPFDSMFPKGQDPNANPSVRRVLQPLARAAEKGGFAVVIVRHLNKKSGESALYRGSGSIGAVGLARAGFTVGYHPENKQGDHVRVLAASKVNIAEKPPSLEVETMAKSVAMTDGSTRSIGRVEWLGASSVNADQVAGARGAKKAEKTKVDQAQDIVSEALRDGPRPAAEVKQLVKNAGIGASSLKQARKRLGVQTKPIGYQGQHMLSLPGKEETPGDEIEAFLAP